MSLTIITNNVPREFYSFHELPAKAKAEFDYEAAQEHDFVKYKGVWYDINEFMRPSGVFPDWHGVHSDTYFSGILIKFVDDCSIECKVIVGRYHS